MDCPEKCRAPVDVFARKGRWPQIARSDEIDVCGGGGRGGRRKRALSPLSALLSDLNQSIFRNYHDFLLGRTGEGARESR